MKILFNIMKWENVLVFLLGFLSCALFVLVFGSSEIEVPFATGFMISDYLESAPSDWVSEDNILVFDDRIILRVENATLSNYADSGSMVPVLDKGANGIRVVPGSAEEVGVGDIVSFRMGSFLVVHRVIKKGVDEDGVYFVVKGDANLLDDGKIRFDDIEYVTIGVIY